MTPAPYDEQAVRRLDRAERSWLADARARLTSHARAAAPVAAHPTSPVPTHPEATR